MSNKPLQPPSVCRMVHYTMQEGHPPCAAVITAVNDDDTVHLCVWNPNGDSQGLMSRPYSDTYQRGHWTYPPRVGSH